MPTAAHRAEYALFAGATALARVAGDRVGRRVGEVLGRIAYRPLGIRRDVVEANLRAAFPGRDEHWIRRTAAASYAHLGREAVQLLRLAALDRETVIARTTVDGLYSLREAAERGRGVVVVAGHLGNWELSGAAVAARDVPVSVVVQRQRNPLFNAAINRTRERLGMRVIDRTSAPRGALRALRDGRVVGFVADQDARRNGVFVPFFGRPASTHRGPALFAVRTRAPVFVIAGTRGDDDRFHVRLSPVDADLSGDVAEAVRRLTAECAARLETAVRRAPTQYFWHHRRWKTRPRGEPPGADAGI